VQEQCAGAGAVCRSRITYLLPAPDYCSCSCSCHFLLLPFPAPAISCSCHFLLLLTALLLYNESGSPCHL
jgi:hypothetical protein